jgi:GNAT superfamily N-acetyltransferase
MSAIRPKERPRPSLQVRARDDGDRCWIEQLWRERWGGAEMVVHEEVFAVHPLQALVAWRGAVRVGLATYRMLPPVCEILSLDSVQPNRGVGTALLLAVAEHARDAGCTCLRVTTTNDNLRALRFYQKRGFLLRELRAGSIDRARVRKPQIPRVGSEGIALRDEIELEMPLVSP